MKFHFNLITGIIFGLMLFDAGLAAGQSDSCEIGKASWNIEKTTGFVEIKCAGEKFYVMPLELLQLATPAGRTYAEQIQIFNKYKSASAVILDDLVDRGLLHQYKNQGDVKAALMVVSSKDPVTHKPNDPPKGLEAQKCHWNLRSRDPEVGIGPPEQDRSFYTVNKTAPGCENLSPGGITKFCAGTVRCEGEMHTAICESTGDAGCPSADECYKMGHSKDSTWFENPRDVDPPANLESRYGYQGKLRVLGTKNASVSLCMGVTTDNGVAGDSCVAPTIGGDCQLASDCKKSSCINFRAIPKSKTNYSVRPSGTGKDAAETEAGFK